jgi:hypothetical protein
MNKYLVFVLLITLITAGCSTEIQKGNINLGNKDVKLTECLTWANNMIPKEFLMETGNRQVWKFANYEEFGKGTMRYNKWANGDSFNILTSMELFSKGRVAGENINYLYPYYGITSYAADYKSEQIVSAEGIILGVNSFTINNLVLKPLPETEQAGSPGEHLIYVDVVNYSISNCNMVSKPDTTLDPEINSKLI